VTDEDRFADLIYDAAWDDYQAGAAHGAAADEAYAVAQELGIPWTPDLERKAVEAVEALEAVEYEFEV
jgi:hypothetical protein